MNDDEKDFVAHVVFVLCVLLFFAIYIGTSVWLTR